MTHLCSLKFSATEQVTLFSLVLLMVNDGMQRLSPVDKPCLPLHGFNAVDLGYQQGDAVSNLVNKMDEPTITSTYLNLFDQIWNDTENIEDVNRMTAGVSRLDYQLQIKNPCMHCSIHFEICPGKPALSD